MSATKPNNFLPGFRLFDGQDLNQALNFPLVAFEGSITAHSGGTKAAAYQLGARINQIDTSAADTDSVLLPAAAPGMSVAIINNSASHAIQVFGAGTDTINAVATGTGISQPSNSTYTYLCAESGKWIAKAAGGGTFTSLSLSGNLAVTGNVAVTGTMAVTGAATFTGLVAQSAAGVSAAGTNQATGTALAANLNNLTNVGSGTGVVLPAAAVGLSVMVANKGANNVVVYGNGSDTIDGTAGATGVTLGHTAGTNSCMFFCVAAATWISAKLGAVAS